MAENEERKRARLRRWQIFYSPLVLIVLLVLFGFLLRAVWGIYNHQIVSDRDRMRAENELAQTQTRLATLQKQVTVLSTSQGVDEELRSKFNVSKAGEGVAVIIGGVAATNSATVIVPTKSWWQKILGFVGL